MNRPYADTWHEYHKAGWATLLLPPRKKSPPPPGFTGEHPYPSVADQQAWAETGADDSNIGIRMPRHVIGIDVDAYDGKNGAETLAKLEAELGPLPPTWRSTSRLEDEISGQRFYTVDPSVEYRQGIENGNIDILRWSHRYAAVYPSWNPASEALYRWFDPAGNVSKDIPNVAELPELPYAWQQALTKVVEPLNAEREHNTRGFFDDTPAGLDIDGYVRNGIPIGSQNETLSRVCASMAARGYTEAEAFNTWSAILAASPSAEGRELWTANDFAPMWRSAYRKFYRAPTQATTTNAADADNELETINSTFWFERPELTIVFEWALSKVISPWALLAAVLAKLIGNTPASVTLPDRGSLNQFFAIVGNSGKGKSRSHKVADMLLQLPEPDNFSDGPVPVSLIGSGEGFIEMYGSRNATTKKIEWARDDHAVMFRVDDVDGWAAQGGRSGSTLVSQLLQAWTAGPLGFGYKNGFVVPEGEYRCVITVGVQPGRGGTLLSQEQIDAGTPQRFLWLPASYPSMPDESPETPEPLQVNTVSCYNDIELGVATAVTDEIDRKLRENIRNDDHADVDGHASFAKLKLAASLALLNNRLGVSVDDWRLAGTIQRVSDITRQSVLTQLAEASHKKAESRGRHNARMNEATATYVEDATLECEKWILRQLASAGKSVERRELHQSTGKYRSVFRSTLDAMVGDGVVMQQSGPNGKKMLSLPNA